MMAITLHKQGRSEKDIALQLTEHAKEEGKADPDSGQPWTFSQSTVNRELRRYKKEYKDEVGKAYKEFVQADIKTDLIAVNEAIRDHRIIGEDKEQPYGTWSDAYMKMCKIIFQKIQHALGVGEGDSIIDEIVKDVEENLPKKLRDRIKKVTDSTGPAITAGEGENVNEPESITEGEGAKGISKYH